MSQTSGYMMKKRVHVLFFDDVQCHNNAGFTPGYFLPNILHGLKFQFSYCTQTSWS